MNKAGILKAQVHEGPQVEQMSEEEHIESAEVVVMAEPLQMEDLVEQGWDVDQAECE